MTTPGNAMDAGPGLRWLINHCGNAPNEVAADQAAAQDAVDQCRANGHGCFVQPLPPAASPETPVPGGDGPGCGYWYERGNVRCGIEAGAHGSHGITGHAFVPPPVPGEGVAGRGCEGTFALLCADGQLHVEHGGVVTGATEQCAREAGEFMDEGRDVPPWTCGPHTVAPAPPAPSGSTEGPPR